VREDLVASAWVVRKPTVDGIVTSLEVFDADGCEIALFFGERKPGTPELASGAASSTSCPRTPRGSRDGRQA
jgi:putative hemin transport protein